MQLRIISFCGLFVFIGLCYLLSNNRKAIKWKTIIIGCLLQFVFAVIILKTPFGVMVFEKARLFFQAIMDFGLTGASFVFGPLVDMDLTRQAFGPGHAFIFAFQISAVIIFISSLMSVLYYIGAMQWVVYLTAKIMQKFMKTSGAESLAAAANIFMGQTEAPLVIRPFLEKMTTSELMALMTGGMATVAGSVLAAYVSFGVDAGHLLAASVMSAPASLVCAKLLVPEVDTPDTEGTVPKYKENIDTNVLDAACRGASEGMQLSINVMAMLIAFIAIIALMNAGIGKIFDPIFGTPVTLQKIIGYFFAPFAWFMGIPKEDIMQSGSILGIRIVLNEFIGYVNLIQLKEVLQPRTFTILTYALCGFANFSSIAIQIGGIGSLIPSRRKDLAKLGLRAMFGGMLASFMTAAIAGMLL